MMKNLAAAGVDPAAIDVILMSHFHGDHLFGLLTKAPENTPVFPNAMIHAHAVEYKFWTDPNVDRLPRRAAASPSEPRRSSRS